MKNNERTFQQWKELANRYFEAETSDAEEEALVRFLATSAAQGKEFDELRAVMGYFVTGRSIYNRPYACGVRMWYYVAAAVMGVIVLITTWQLTERTNVCVAYINGKRCTDKEIVFSEALKSVEKVRHRPPEETVEIQLSDLFQTLEENSTVSIEN